METTRSKVPRNRLRPVAAKIGGSIGEAATVEICPGDGAGGRRQVDAKPEGVRDGIAGARRKWRPSPFQDRECAGSNRASRATKVERRLDQGFGVARGSSTSGGHDEVEAVKAAAAENRDNRFVPQPPLQKVFQPRRRFRRRGARRRASADRADCSPVAPSTQKARLQRGRLLPGLGESARKQRLGPAPSVRSRREERSRAVEGQAPSALPRTRVRRAAKAAASLGGAPSSRRASSKISQTASSNSSCARIRQDNFSSATTRGCDGIDLQNRLHLDRRLAVGRQDLLQTQVGAEFRRDQTGRAFRKAVGNAHVLDHRVRASVWRGRRNRRAAAAFSAAWRPRREGRWP